MKLSSADKLLLAESLMIKQAAGGLNLLPRIGGTVAGAAERLLGSNGAAVPSLTNAFNNVGGKPVFEMARNAVPRAWQVASNTQRFNPRLAAPRPPMPTAPINPMPAANAIGPEPKSVLQSINRLNGTEFGVRPPAGINEGLQEMNRTMQVAQNTARFNPRRVSPDMMGGNWPTVHPDLMGTNPAATAGSSWLQGLTGRMPEGMRNWMQVPGNQTMMAAGGGLAAGAGGMGYAQHRVNEMRRDALNHAGVMQRLGLAFQLATNPNGFMNTMHM